jgi:SAM-dependent methyltransferase
MAGGKNDSRERHVNSVAENELGLRGLLEMARAGLRSQVLYAANQLGVFKLLSPQPQSAAQLAEQAALDSLAMQRLLDACVALGLLRKSNGCYANSVTAETYLAPGKPGYIGEAVDMFRWRVAPKWQDLLNALRGNRPSNMYDSLVNDRQQLERFIEGLRQLSFWRARALASRLDLSSFRKLLDVGAGSGVYSIEILKRNRELRAYLFDQAPVCEIAKRNVERAGLAERTQVVAGDFFCDELPRADLLLVSNVLHDFPVEKVQLLLRKVFASLEPGGTLLINDFILDDDDAGPVDGALMSLVLFLETDGAGNYSARDYGEWLTAAGFQETEIFTLYESDRVIRARKPAQSGR